MGHLGNPIAFRLSYKKSWENTWFIKNSYYPEFINSMINLKDFLYYYLTRKYLLYSGVSLSHLYFLKINKLFLFKIYIYHIDLEKNTVIVLNEAYSVYYQLLYNKTWGRKTKKKRIDKVFSYLHNADVYVSIFFCFLNYFKINRNKRFFKYYKNVKKRINKLVYINILCKIIKSKIIRVLYENRIPYKKKVFMEKLKQKIYSFVKIKRNKKYKLHSANYEDVKYFLEYWKENFKDVKFMKKIFKNLGYKGLIVNKKFPILGYKMRKGVFNYSLIYCILYFLKKVNFKKYKTFINFDYKWIRFLKFFKMIKIFGNFKKFTNVINGYRFLGALFITLYEKKKEMKNPYKRLYNFRTVIYYFVYNWLYNVNVESYFGVFFNVMKYYIYILNNKIKNVCLNLYFLTNEIVPAVFIGKYIALRLKRNFYLRKIIFTVKRQLYKLMRYNCMNRKAYKLYDYDFIMKIKIDKFKKKFKEIYINIFILFKKYLYKYFKLNDFLGTFYIYFFQKFMKIKLNKLIFYNIMIEIFNLFSLYKNNLYKLNWYYFNIIYSKLLALFNMKTVLLYKKRLNKQIICISSFFYKNYINYIYLKNVFNRFQHLNMRNIRQRYNIKYKGILMGFKMAFRGRFSRKQRASFAWIQQGKIPLNTLNVDVDYSFHTIPLKNSAISVKIWLYRNDILKLYRKQLVF